MPTPRADEDELGSIGDLWPAEHLLIWTLRAIACGGGDCPAVRRALVGVCGNAADEALNTIFVVVQYIGMIGTRRLALHPPGCACVNADERALVALMAAAQDSLGGDVQSLNARLDQLSLQPRPGLVQALQLVAKILLDSGCRLRVGAVDGRGRRTSPPVLVSTCH